MKPLIFLDVDGVLNSHVSNYELHQPYIVNLRTLVVATDAQIILSSSWQNFVKKENNEIVSKSKAGKLLIDALAKENLKIFDKVLDDEVSPAGKRHQEILSYLRKNFSYEIGYPNFVILDDAQGFNTTKLTEALYILKSLI